LGRHLGLQRCHEFNHEQVGPVASLHRTDLQFCQLGVEFWFKSIQPNGTAHFGDFFEDFRPKRTPIIRRKHRHCAHPGCPPCLHTPSLCKQGGYRVFARGRKTHFEVAHAIRIRTIDAHVVTAGWEVGAARITPDLVACEDSQMHCHSY
jgi:hypothetical protein